MVGIPSGRYSYWIAAGCCGMTNVMKCTLGNCACVVFRKRFGRLAAMPV